jgi:hypothetical protein
MGCLPYTPNPSNDFTYASFTPEPSPYASLIFVCTNTYGPPGVFLGLRLGKWGARATLPGLSGMGPHRSWETELPSHSPPPVACVASRR